MKKAQLRTECAKVFIGYELRLNCKQCGADLLEVDPVVKVIFGDAIMDFFCNIDCLMQYLIQFKQNMEEE